MQVKVFEAKDMASGLKMVRNELGPEALILSTRSVKSGKLGLLGKSTLEITAAIDQPFEKDITTDRQNSAQQDLDEQLDIFRFPKKKKPSFSAKADDAIERPDYRKEIHHTAANTTGRQGYNHTAQPHVQPQNIVPSEINNSLTYRAESASVAATEQLKMEMHELKKMVRSLTTEVSRLNHPGRNQAGTMQQNTLSQNGKDATDEPLIQYLLNCGINLETSVTISEFAQDIIRQDDLQDTELLNDYLRKTIAPLLQTQAVDFSSVQEQKRIALVGPTGVGKTTTLAKMAAGYLAAHSNSIALITVDTYRIAAVEQLKVYGDIMQLPVEVVLNPGELSAALYKHRDKELILIDTAGRSPKDNYCIDELELFFQQEHDIEKHLVLSATTRESELLHSLQQFDRLGIDQTIFTKIDECEQLGVLLNIQIENPNPISFLTNGQRVPEDIIQADQHTIAELIIPEIQPRQEV